MVRVIIRVGVHGFAGSGKDTFADALVHQYGFTKIAFADPLKDLMIDLDPLLMIEDGQPVYLNDVLRVHGWEEAKDLYPDIRRMLVSLGESAKARLHQRVWLNHALARAEGIERVVFSDVRYLVEATTLREFYGATLVEIRRPGIGPANEQEAKSLPPDLFQYVIRNDGDRVDLQARADMLMHRIHVEREGSAPPAAKVIA